MYNWAMNITNRDVKIEALNRLYIVVGDSLVRRDRGNVVISSTVLVDGIQLSVSKVLVCLTEGNDYVRAVLRIPASELEEELYVKDGLIYRKGTNKHIKANQIKFRGMAITTNKVIRCIDSGEDYTKTYNKANRDKDRDEDVGTSYKDLDSLYEVVKHRLVRKVDGYIVNQDRLLINGGMYLRSDVIGSLENKSDCITTNLSRIVRGIDIVERDRLLVPCSVCVEKADCKQECWYFDKYVVGKFKGRVKNFNEFVGDSNKYDGSI